MTDSSSRAGRPRKPRDKVQLTRDAWLDAAAAAIAEGGFDNVRVLVLAKKLGVTRGSFYWHFKDHHDLIVSFLERWRDRRLRERDYWQPSAGAGEDVAEELRHKLRALFSEAASNMRRLRVELAIREYARRDGFAAAIVAEVDHARIEQNVSLLQQLSKDPAVSQDLAQLLYVTTIGAQLLLTGPAGDEPTIARIEELITQIVVQWRPLPEGGGGAAEAPAPGLNGA